MKENQFKYTHIPTHYLATKSLDERFLQIKVYVLHTGENYNGSIFEKEVVERAIPSLANTPILAFVKYEQEKDFAGHEIDLIIENGEYSWKYKGQAYGVIPEENNARWEFMVGSDGIEREYLVVDAIIWKKFGDAVEIISRDLVKGQSMELSEKYSGHFNRNGFFVFDQFKFDGCAILGQNVEPAMNSAKVEMQFSMATIKDSIKEMMKEYNSKFSKEVGDVKIEELLKQYGLTREQVIEAGIEIHTFSDSNIEKFKEELDKIMREKDLMGDEKDKEKENDQNKGDVERKQIDPQNQDDKQQDNFKEFDKDDENKEQKGEDNEQQKLEEDKREDKKDVENASKDGQNKGISKDNNVDAKKDEEDLKDKFQKLQEQFTKLEKNYSDLVEYKESRERQDHKTKVENLISTFERLNDEDVKEIREKVFHYTFEEIEEKLYAILGKKQLNTKNSKQTQFAKFYVTDNVENEANKPSYDHLFKKHLNK